MPTSNNLQIARALLCSLLANQPMKGATLKLRMLRDFESRAGESFDSAFRIYPKFSSFLADNADLVVVERPAAGIIGDITVRLRSDGTGKPADCLAQANLPKKPPDSYLPNPVWLAFTNPDPHRRRFFNRESFKVEHYLSGGEPPDFAGGEWAEIRPAPAPDQAGWMRQFIESEPLSAAVRDRLTPIAEQPYSSASLKLFRAAAGEHMDAWRRFRTNKVMAFVREWCESTGVPFNKVSRPVAEMPSESGHGGRVPALRETLIHAIRSASDEELQRILVPASFLALAARAYGR